MDRLHATPEDVDSLLKVAVLEGDLSNVRYYLKHGADVNCVNTDECSSLCLAVCVGHVEL